MSEFRFQTEVALPDFAWKTGYEKKNLFMGSCFTENVGNKMAGLKYDTDINPFGILYNPLSVANGLEFLIRKRTFQKNDLIQHDKLWHSFYHHGRFSAASAEDALRRINERIHLSSEYLKSADFLFITFGTAWVYNFVETGQTVSNCHKIPAYKFQRVRLTVAEIVERYENLLAELWKLNPEMKIVFTVSPIRHWKDGAAENQRSKATLLLAVDEIIKNSPENCCSYFPSYEIVMDELRDYRFYAEDMIHLSDVAVNYIWEKFQKKLIDEESRRISNQVQKIASALNHKPFNRFTDESLLFLNRTLENTERIATEYHFLDFDNELKFLSEQIEDIEENKKRN